MTESGSHVGEGQKTVIGSSICKPLSVTLITLLPHSTSHWPRRSTNPTYPLITLVTIRPEYQIVQSLQFTLEDGTDKDFRNIVISQPWVNPKTEKYNLKHDESYVTHRCKSAKTVSHHEKPRFSQGTLVFPLDCHSISVPTSLVSDPHNAQLDRDMASQDDENKTATFFSLLGYYEA